MITWTFLKHFSIPELLSIAGKWYRNFFMLTGIFLIALFAIGLGKGATSYLRVKMNDPFIKFITVIIPYGFEDDNNFRAHIRDPEVKKRFFIQDILEVYTGYADFKGLNQKSKNALVRGVKKEDKFYKFLKANPKIIRSDISNNTLFEKTRWGCIVTEGFLKKLGHNSVDVPYLHYILPHHDKEIIVPLPVSAVITQLPDYVDILVSETLLSAFNGAYEDTNPLDINLPDHNGYIRIFSESDTIKESLSSLSFKEMPNETFVDGYLMELRQPRVTYNEIEKKLGNVYFQRVYYFDGTSGSPRPLTEDYISISFSKLDSVPVFQEHLLAEHKLKIEMATIEAKENFKFFENLSTVLSWSLIAFSILTIVIFITNLVVSHLEINKKNLGTLKAFGLPNNYIIRLYTGISIALVTGAFLISYAISLLAGDVAIKVILMFFDLGSGAKSIQFESYPFYMLVIYFICLPAVLIFGKLYSSLSNITPGDLIYGRD